MHELVLIISDLYLAQENPERQLPQGVSLPGLQHVARFGTRVHVPSGWRAWLSRWLTGREPDGVASVAAFALTRPDVAPTMSPATSPAASGAASSAASGTARPAASGAALGAPPRVWMATPVHLIAGMTSVHLDRRSVLRLTADDQAALASEFQRVFHDSGFYLQPLESGDFLLAGPQSSVLGWLEPSRAMGSSIADARSPGGADHRRPGGIDAGDARNADARASAGSDPALRRLGAEIEMWLHEHPVNAMRARRGEAPVTGLWLWGGGPAPSAGASTSPVASTSPGMSTSPAASTPTGASASPGAPLPAGASATPSAVSSPQSDITFGSDAFLQGLSLSIGQKVLPLPAQLADVFSYPGARRAALVIEIGPMLQSHPTWTFFDAMAQIDRDFVEPATAALRAGTLDRLVILANDYQLTLRPRDRFKLWRRTPPGLSGLQ